MHGSGCSISDKFWIRIMKTENAAFGKKILKIVEEKKLF
jgi:hypothetical protein